MEDLVREGGASSLAPNSPKSRNKSRKEGATCLHGGDERGTLNSMILAVALALVAALVAALVRRSNVWAGMVATLQLMNLVEQGAVRPGDAALLWTVMMRWHLKGRSVWVSPERLAEASRAVGPDMAEKLGPCTVQALQLAGDRYWEKYQKLLPEDDMEPIIQESWRLHPEERPQE